MYVKIGFLQCLAMVPGVSRSGATIVGGMLLGADKRAAAEFSFFLAMPTMAGAFAYDLLKNYKILTANDIQLIVIGLRRGLRVGALRRPKASGLRVPSWLHAIRLVALGRWRCGSCGPDRLRLRLQARRLVRIAAEIVDRAAPAFRLARLADVAAVQDQPVMSVEAELVAESALPARSASPAASL